MVILDYGLPVCELLKKSFNAVICARVVGSTKTWERTGHLEGRVEGVVPLWKGLWK